MKMSCALSSKDWWWTPSPSSKKD